MQVLAFCTGLYRPNYYLTSSDIEEKSLGGHGRRCWPRWTLPSPSCPLPEVASCDLSCFSHLWHLVVRRRNSAHVTASGVLLALGLALFVTVIAAAHCSGATSLHQASRLSVRVAALSLRRRLLHSCRHRSHLPAAARVAPLVWTLSKVGRRHVTQTVAFLSHRAMSHTSCQDPLGMAGRSRRGASFAISCSSCAL